LATAGLVASLTLALLTFNWSHSAGAQERFSVAYRHVSRLSTIIKAALLLAAGCIIATTLMLMSD
jgi:hypothetical protein